MAARYTLRMQFGPHLDPARVTREVLEVCRTARADEIMFFAYAEEQNDGHDPLDRIRLWLDSIRPAKQALERAGIEVSLNPWHTQLHCDRGRRFKPDQLWQPMMDWRGQVAAAMVCPLDPGWQAYYRQALELFAAERFRVIWIDDDIRFHNHAPLDWGGCWCPLHLAEFNRRAGVTTTRDELVRRATQPGPPHPWRALWLDLWDETQSALIAEWRDLVEAHGTRLGMMTSLLEVHGAEGRRWERWWRASARRFPPTHRPHFWSYSEGAPSVLAYGLAQLQLSRQAQPPEVESDPEIENVPYTPWNKSYRQTLAQMAMAQAFGSTRLAVSLYDFMGNWPSDDPERAAFLGRVKPLLAWLGDCFPTAWQPLGVGVPWHEDMGRQADTGDDSHWRALTLDTHGWDHWLGALGCTFQKRPQAELNALAGRMPSAFSDDALRAWLSKGLLLDGPAAAACVARGFGDLIGFQSGRTITQADVLYSMEECAEAAFGLRVGGQMSLNAWVGYGERLWQGDLLRGAQTVSVLRGPTQTRVGHGVVCFENRLGGRVAVLPFEVNSQATFCAHRQAQIVGLLRWLGRDRAWGRVSGGAWLTPQFFTDGAAWRGIVWNGSPDDVTELRVDPPHGLGPLRTAVHGDAQGRRHAARVEGSRVIFEAAPLRQWECVALNVE